MLDVRATNYHTVESPLQASLWRCEGCNSFVSIHSPQTVEQALCPICKSAALEFCGSFQSILGLQFADA
jgi:rubrerythrin